MPFVNCRGSVKNGSLVLNFFWGGEDSDTLGWCLNKTGIYEIENKKNLSNFWCSLAMLYLVIRHRRKILVNNLNTCLLACQTN